MILKSDKPTPTGDGEFYFQWHFTSSCNIRCAHCYQTDYSSNGLTIDHLLCIAEKIDSTLSRWRRQGRISLTGGEPFLNVEKLHALLSYFEDADSISWVGILTNGTLISKEISRALAQYKKIKEVQVSLDGASSPVHDAIRGVGSFERAINGLKKLTESGIPTSIMYTLSKLNSNDALSIIDLAAEIGVSAITIERATPGSAEDDTFSKEDVAEIYSKVMEKKTDLKGTSPLKIRTSRPLWCLTDPNAGGFCPAGLSCLTILHDGTMLPCRRLEIPLGNILNDSIYKIWYTSDVLWKIRNKALLDDDCRTCGLLASCGGCRAMAYAITGDYMGKDPQCWKVNTT